MKGGDGVFSNSQEFVSQPDKRQRSEEIPEEVVFQILPLLPVKSLRRFNCVRKSWRNLISDSQFQKMHLNQSIKANRLKYVLCECHRCFKLDYETLISGKEIEMEEITYASLFRPVIKDDSTKICSTEVLGSCNGLLCILTHYRMALTYKSTLVLANPSTRETKIIFTQLKVLSSFRFGFGYDTVNDDYKVLKIKPETLSIDVYSLRKNKWDHKGSSPNYRHAMIRQSTGKYVNGTIHWLARTRNIPLIIAFDLTKEEFVNIPPPPCTNNTLNDDLGSDGRYLYSCHSCCDGKYEIWKMETYGVAESWKCISLMLGEPERRFIYNNSYYLNLLNFPISEIDLYYVYGRLVLHNRRNKKIRWVKLKQIVQGNTSLLTAFSYVESLISMGGN